MNFSVSGSAAKRQGQGSRREQWEQARGPGGSDFSGRCQQAAEGTRHQTGEGSDDPGLGVGTRSEGSARETRIPGLGAGRAVRGARGPRGGAAGEGAGTPRARSRAGLCSSAVWRGFRVSLPDGARSGDGPVEIPSTMSSVTLTVTVLHPKSAEGQLPPPSLTYHFHCW